MESKAKDDHDENHAEHGQLACIPQDFKVSPTPSLRNQLPQKARLSKYDSIRNHPSGTHSFSVNNVPFVVDAKYKPIKVLGFGAFGVVVSAMDTDKDRVVAIKKISRVFDDLEHARNVLREIHLLRHFQHSNVVQLLDIIPPVPHADFNDLYLVTNFFETDLHKIIYSSNKLTDEHVQYLIWQILRGLKYMHSANVIHRDLKPSNLLLNANCELAICDFGLARGLLEQANIDLTQYVVTRHYRAPEVMCSSAYNEKIDVWSVGCVMAELLGRSALFPGTDYLDQMNLIFQVLGTPSADDLKCINNKQAYDYVIGLEPITRVPFKTLFPNSSPEALDLLNQFLQFDPEKRCTVEEALAHPYLSALHDETLETTCPRVFDTKSELESETQMSREYVERLLLREIAHFRRFVTI
jgi:serine/threonine protein kinase